MYIGTRTGYYKTCATRVSWARESGDYPPPHHIWGIIDTRRVCFGEEVVSERSCEGVGLNLSACCCCSIAGVAGCLPPAPTTTVFVTGIHDALSNDALPQLQSAFLRANSKQSSERCAPEERVEEEAAAAAGPPHYGSTKYPF
jgi:hypothetical protein